MALCKPGRVGASCLVNGFFNFCGGCRASCVSTSTSAQYRRCVCIGSINILLLSQKFIRILIFFVSNFFIS